MYKVLSLLAILFIGGCVSNTPPDSSSAPRPSSEENLVQPAFVAEEPAQEPNTPVPSDEDSESLEAKDVEPLIVEDDPLFQAQAEAEYAIRVYGDVKKNAQDETKPVSYERSIIRNPTYLKRFIETWKGLDGEKTQSVSFEDPKLAFTKDVYSELLESSKQCCLAGIATELERRNLDKEKTYAFLKDDYNFYRAGELCYFYSARDVATIFERSDELREIVELVQKNCLCLNKDRLKEKTTILYALLNNHAVNRRSLVYRSVDDFGRQTTRYIISDIKNVDKKLRRCLPRKGYR
ncbi:MAG: hypothetical protein JW812_02825 [Alphaproteobacteria bacterium]|nr:hypothetical protein [Alphaproteobacteria bacterium]MBN2779888.1 hypothetical protein [Alphaproteobacteria bacterium]